MLTQVVILVGGMGTRLGERTKATPKPLLHVGGRRFLDYLLNEISRYPTIRKIQLLAGYRAEQVVELYHGSKWRNAEVSVLCEPSPLGTAGALRFAAHALEPLFLLMNGDTYFDFNLLDLFTRPEVETSLLRMALTRNVQADRYGRIALDGDRVAAFLPPGRASGGLVNAGVYRIDRRILEFIDRSPLSLEQDVFPHLVAKRKLGGVLYDGYFIDIGVPVDFNRAQSELPGRMRRGAVFFDRDGVLNKDNGYVHKPGDFEWVDGAREAVKLCNDKGYYTFVVTNQAGVAHGYYDVDTVLALHEWMNVELALRGAHIDEFQFCPFHENGVVQKYRRLSTRRKPEPGMIFDCLANWPVARELSMLIGDKSHDVEAAKAAGISGHLFPGANLEAFLSTLLR